MYPHNSVLIQNDPKLCTPYTMTPCFLDLFSLSLTPFPKVSWGYHGSEATTIASIGLTVVHSHNPRLFQNLTI
jgi:hypothetical protein